MNKAILQTNVGTPIQVLVLPTPSASLTGLVYHLISDDKHYVVANGEWKVLSVDDYNMLKNLPIINQDLTSTDFAIVEGNYYRHIGNTNDTFTNGIIYYYQDGEFKKLGINDYNMLKNLPIINQDLDATGFVGIEGAYYRHIGSSTNEGLVPGTIYRYQNGILTSLATNNDIQSLVGKINTLLESIDMGAGV